jgi:surface polysaccharide O-acyltransferase-like enzyme
LKVFACLAVVAAHTLNITKGPLNMIFAMSAVICIPTFLQVGGYLMLKRPGFNWRYAGKKIVTILLVCLAWETLHAAAHFVAYREIRPFVQSWLLDFFQQGLFYHFWYMGALMLVYLYMPLADKLYRYSEKAYLAVLLLLGLVNTGLDAAALLTKNHMVEALPQSLRLHFWYFYAMLGGWIARNPQAVSALAKKPFTKSVFIPMPQVFFLTKTAVLC